MISIVVYNKSTQSKCLEILAGLPLEKKWRIDIKDHKSARSVEQNSRYWAILQDIAEQVKTDIPYSPETWHRFFSAKFLGKDTIIIDGAPILIAKTTTKLNVVEFSDYMLQIESWAVEHGVKFITEEYFGSM